MVQCVVKEIFNMVASVKTRGKADGMYHHQVYVDAHRTRPKIGRS
jgi:hypothetical protein